MTRPKRAVLLAPTIGILISPLLHVSSLGEPLQAAAASTTISQSLAEAGRATHAVERQAFLRTPYTYDQRSTPDDVSALPEFPAVLHHSLWAPALFTNIGLSDLHYGYSSRSLEASRQAWEEGKKVTNPHVRPLSDRADGKLVLAQISASASHGYDRSGRNVVTGFSDGTCIVNQYNANGNKVAATVSKSGPPETSIWGTGTWGCFVWTTP